MVLLLSLIHIYKEYVDHVLRYYQITASGGSYPANGMQIPHYLQTDYGNIPYGGGSDVYKRQIINRIQIITRNLFHLFSKYILFSFSELHINI